MEYSSLLSEVSLRKLVPVVKLDRVEDALPLAEALCAGGLPVAEITFRTPAARQSIENVAKAFPNMLVGAGTIVNVEQAKSAIDAGAQFLVSPGFSAEVTEYALKNKVMIFPGACTPTEIMMTLSYELPVIKFFPAQQFGGLSTIRALGAPFPQLKFMPTGGISESNIKEYLAEPKIVACGGSWMVKDSLITAGKFDEIQDLTARAVKLLEA